MISQKMCGLVQDISGDIWKELDFAFRYSTSIEETTLTHLIWKSILKCQTVETVATKKPGNAEEFKTGADLEWWFIDRKSEKSIGLRIQSKIINKTCTGYNKLKYKVGDEYQINILIESARNEKMIPFYSFYSYSYSEIEPRRAWEFAFAHKIKEVFVGSIKTIHNREVIKEFLYPAEELFCSINSIEDLVYLFSTVSKISNPEQYIKDSLPDYINSMLKSKQENIKDRIGGKWKQGTMSPSARRDLSFIEMIRNTFKNVIKLSNLLKRERLKVSSVEFPAAGPDVEYIMVSLFE